MGDRFVASAFDVLERRIEFRRLTDRGRQAVIKDRNVCRKCMATEVAERRAEASPTPASLFEEREEVQ